MNKRRHKGFTLVELVVGIVVLAIAMLIMTTMLTSQSKDALEPLYRLRASQLGQSIMKNVLTRAYDENSDHNGGFYRCGEIWGDTNSWYDFYATPEAEWTSGGTPTTVPCSGVLGVDAANGEVAGEHFNFNDVDDFIEDNFVSAITYGNVVGGAFGGPDYSTQYTNYAVKIAVSLDNSQAFTMKKITVTIKTPSSEEIQFTSLKGNY